MPKISQFLLATTVILTASTSVFGMPLRASSGPDSSFSVFFDPGTASLSKEGQEIISVAATRFAASHSRHSAAHILLTSETDDQDSAFLSNERIKAVGNQLVRDGIQRKFVSTDEHPSVHAAPIRLEEWLDRRVSISIQEDPVIARPLAG
jgi:outer membrane protein OmpA-like peptidoglycan-associated protein